VKDKKMILSYFGVD